MLLAPLCTLLVVPAALLFILNIARCVVKNDIQGPCASQAKSSFLSARKLREQQLCKQTAVLFVVYHIYDTYLLHDLFVVVLCLCVCASLFVSLVLFVRLLVGLNANHVGSTS